MEDLTLNAPERRMIELLCEGKTVMEISICMQEEGFKPANYAYVSSTLSALKSYTEAKTYTQLLFILTQRGYFEIPILGDLG